MNEDLRSYIFEGVQAGIEADNAHGTAVPGDLRLSQTTVMATPNVPSEDIDEQGGVGPVGNIVSKSQTDIQYNGKVNTTELLFWLANLLRAPDVSAVGTLVTSVITVPQYTKLTPQAMTLELGGEDGQARVAGVLSKDMTITLFPNAAPTFSGNAFGGVYEDSGITLTEDPTSVGIAPVGPTSVYVVIANDVAGLSNSGNKLKDGMLLQATLTISNIRAEHYAIEDTTTVSGAKQTKPTITLAITVEGNAQATGYMTAMKAGTIRYCRIRLGGPTIGGNATSIELDFPFQFKDPGRGESEGLFTANYLLRACYDGNGGSALGTMLRATVKTTQGTAGIPGTTFEELDMEENYDSSP